MTDGVGWRAVFWLTAPAALAAAALVGPMDRADTRRTAFHVDLPGQSAGMVGLVLLVAGVIEAGHDAGSPVSWALLLAGAATLVGFVQIERRARTPMLPLASFRSPGIPAAVIGGFVLQFGAYGLQFFLAIHLQTSWGVTAAMAGLLLAPYAIGMVVAAIALNPVLQPRGPRCMLAVGGLAAVAGSLALLPLGSVRLVGVLLAAEFVIGAGTGVYTTALNATVGVALGPAGAGLASGIYNTARQIGQSVGIAVLGGLAALSNADDGYFVAIALITACAAVVAAIGLRRPPNHRSARAE